MDVLHVPTQRIEAITVHHAQELPVRGKRRGWQNLGDDRHTPADSKNEQCRSARLANPDPHAHRQRMAKQSNRRAHAVELQGLNGLS
jgi:hypothetical protein